MNSFLKLIIIYSLTIGNVVKADATVELHCSSDNDCDSFEDKLIGSDCRDGKCTCYVRRSANNSEIMPCTPRSNTKIFGERSHTPHTKCSDGVCNCEDEFIKSIDGDRCIPKAVMLGKSCENSEQCKEIEKISECIEQVCQCSKGFSEIGNTCRSVVNKSKRTDKCKTGDCQENEECFSDICVCKKGFVASSTKGKCIPFAYFNETCEDELQCEHGLGMGSVCENGACICNLNHTHFAHDDGTICQKIIHYGDSCKNHNECVAYKQPTTMTCKNYKCVCAEDHELFDAYTRHCVSSKFLRSSSDNAKPLHVFTVLVLIYGVAIMIN